MLVDRKPLRAEKEQPYSPFSPAYCVERHWLSLQQRVSSLPRLLLRLLSHQPRLNSRTAPTTPPGLTPCGEDMDHIAPITTCCSTISIFVSIPRKSSSA